MGRPCSRHGRDVPTLFWYKNLKEGHHQEDIDVDLTQTGCENVE
jgi:hypothetical protein